jgi:outer membrane protein TolC
LKTKGSPLICAALIFGISMLVTHPAALAESGGVQYSFSEIWKLARSQAPDIVAADHELEGARINEVRMSRHWYPRVFVEGRAFSTNDPAQTFMSLLGQRQISPSDFAPPALNQPGSGFYERGTLGFDFPLFEGGAKVAAADASRKVTEAKSFEQRSAELAQYAELAESYSSILILRRQRAEIQNLADGVGETLSRYKIGAKSNPVGYSGLLGLKTLRNRLDGLLVENSAKSATLRNRIRIVAKGLPENWEPRSENLQEFVSAHLTGVQTGPSMAVRAMRSSAESLESAKDAEKARFLPKVGLFGTGDLYGGSRSAATSFTGGAYVQWDLFSAPNLGTVGQAEHVAAAAQARADGAGERAEMERSGALQSAKALDRNLALMSESAKLLEDQTTVARGLFRNGSINALQLVEVLARRADLLVGRADAELGLAHARATLLVTSGAEGVSRED